MKKIRFFFNIIFLLNFGVYSQENAKEIHHNIELVIKKIQYLNNKERLYTIKNLQKLSLDDKKKLFPILAEISIKDRDPLIQEASLNFLTENQAECEICIEAYKKNLYHSVEIVKLAALKGIETLRLKHLEKDFLSLLQQSDFSENSVFLGALIRTLGVLEYNEKEISEFLKQKYNEETTHKELKRKILLYAGNSKNLIFLDIIEKSLEANDDMYLQGYAINAIGKLENLLSLEQKDRWKEKLKKIYQDISLNPDPKERAKYNLLKQQIMLTLIRFKDHSLVEEIKIMALDDDANTRKKAIEYINELDLKEFKDLLEIKYKYDPSKTVKKEAEKVLKKWNLL